MAEPTSSLSFYDLILRVAKAAGVAYYGAAGDERAMIPIDEHDLERCKDVVNQGIKTFIADAPPTGWRWQNRIMEVTLGTVQTEGTCSAAGDATSLIDTDLEDTYDEDTDLDGYYVYDKTKEIYAAVESYDASAGDITVAEWLDYDDNVSSLTPAKDDVYSITDVKTIDGDKARYPLSQDFMGEVTGKITYAKSSGRGHIIDWDSEGAVRFQREVTVTTGHPNRAAVRPWRNRRWELIVDPSPTSGDTLIFPYKIGFDKLLLEAGIATAGAATTLTDATRRKDNEINDYFIGWVIHIISGVGKYEYATIDDFVRNTGVFLFNSGLSEGSTPTTTSVYYVEPVNNKHPAGIQFDNAILSACLMEAELEFESLQIDYSPSEKYMKKDLPAAYRIDARSAPKKLGVMLPGTRRGVGGRTWNNVGYTNERNCGPGYYCP